MRLRDLDVCVCLCLCLSFWGLEVLKNVSERLHCYHYCHLVGFPVLHTCLTHGENQWGQISDDYGQFWSVSEGSKVWFRYYFCPSYSLQKLSIAKRGQMRNLMVLRCSMVHFKSYHRLARLPHKWHTCNLVWGHVPIGVWAVHNHLIASALTQWWGGNRKSILNEVVHYISQLHKTTHVSCLIIGIAVTFNKGDDKISDKNGKFFQERVGRKHGKEKGKSRHRNRLRFLKKVEEFFLDWQI